MAESVSGLGIPPSQHVVDVSVINTTTSVKNMPLGFFVKDPMPGHEIVECPSYAFLIETQTGRKVLFDLGMRTDTKSFPPVIQNGMASLDMSADKDVATILREDGRVALDQISSIIWSHWHTDHIGDPSTFPSTTELVVGPGSKAMLLPGYPTNPHGLILESDYEGRQLRELDFETDLRIGQFRAVDFFNDGSFYLLDSPGHAAGHMCALARTTPSTFVFMGGDGCHHCGFLRPSKQRPLPNELRPSPFSVPPFAPGTICPGSLLLAIHPNNSQIEPYYTQLSAAESRDVAAAEATISKMIPFDESDDVFVVIAHDKTLLDVIDFFPNKANDWKEKGWKEISRWRFLEDFKAAVAKVDVA